MKEAVVIAPSWPGTTGGMEIATRSDIAAYHSYFERVCLLVLSEKKPAGNWSEEFPHIDFRHIRIDKRPIRSRFLRSLGRRDPSITLQYRDLAGPVTAALAGFRRESARKCPPAVIFLDIPISVLIPMARKIYPDSPVICHSHNVNSRAFAGFARRGSLFSRLAWGYELARIRRHECRVAAASDRFWSISEHDRADYLRLLGIRPDGVLGVYLDSDRYVGLPAGDPETIVHVGRIDLRKGRGMARFIELVWPLLRKSRPGLRLLLGGAGTERFDNPAAGIRGLGFVENELEVLEQGMIFINPQIDGSGIQLKSVVAMLSGRLLITSVTGAEGIAGSHPDHFLAENNPEGVAELILEAIQNPSLAMATALRGQVVAREAYDKRNFLCRAHALLDAALAGIHR